ncbi:MAG: helix-turn-helix domain-containing protein, partial [Candidatus Dormibacterales bacterium]
LRVEEAADRLSLGRSKVYELIREGRLPVVHIGRSVRVPVRSLQAFVAELMEAASREQAGEPGPGWEPRGVPSGGDATR